MPRHAMGDTWGISGATFAVAYALLAAGAVGAALLHRHRALAGSDRTRADEPHPQQVAYRPLWSGPPGPPPNAASPPTGGGFQILES